MRHSGNSPLHRSGNVLCRDLTGRTQSVNRNSLVLETPHRFQPLEPSSPGGRACSPTISTFMLAPDGSPRMFRPMISMSCGYYAEQFPMCNQNVPQSPSYYYVANSSFTGHVCDSFVPAYQPPGVSVDFGGILSEPVVTHQPSTPPTAPEEFIPSNLAFHYHPCRWLGGPPCDGQAPGKNREMGEHLRTFHRFVGHERDSVQCDWEGCGQVIQRMNVPRHIVSRHLLAAANCRFCRKRFSRPDVVARHERTCNVGPPTPSTSTPRI